MVSVKRFIILTLAILAGILSIQSAIAYVPGYHDNNWYAEDYFTQTYHYYYPTEYISPARTGLPNSAYFYPNKYVNTWRWYSGYRSYSHSAYNYDGYYGTPIWGGRIA